VRSIKESLLMDCHCGCSYESIWWVRVKLFNYC